jgi:hypothetical protein
VAPVVAPVVLLVLPAGQLVQAAALLSSSVLYRPGSHAAQAPVAASKQAPAKHASTETTKLVPDQRGSVRLAAWTTQPAPALAVS